MSSQHEQRTKRDREGREEEPSGAPRHHHPPPSLAAEHSATPQPIGARTRSTSTTPRSSSVQHLDYDSLLHNRRFEMYFAELWCHDITYVLYPCLNTYSARLNSGGSRQYKLIIGETAENLNDQILAFVIRRVCGAMITHAEKNGHVWHVFVQDKGDQKKITESCNKRVLFDAAGFWYAANDEEQIKLETWVKTRRRYVRSPAECRLPFNSMVVEPAPTTSATTTSPSH